MNLPIIYIIGFLIILFGCSKDENTIDNNDETLYETIEDGEFPDLLTPNYYNTDNTELRNKINNFIHFARLTDYKHPFEDQSGKINTTYTIGKDFGYVNKGVQYHPAIDMHPGNASDITLYAAYDGIVHTYRDSPKYRHYLSITKDIHDDENNLLGKLVTIYAHVDLDKDENDNLSMDGIQVKQGDIVSKNLYSGTVGGPHLHLEIRFYRDKEDTDQDFYFWQQNETYTTPSSGTWSYGYWNPNIGYGYGNPGNMGIN